VHWSKTLSTWRHRQVYYSRPSEDTNFICVCVAMDAYFSPSLLTLECDDGDSPVSTLKI